MDEKSVKDIESAEYSPPRRSQKMATGLMLVGMCAAITYAFLEHRSVKQLAASRNELSAALDQQRAQLQTLTQKLLAAEAAPAPQPAANSPAEEQVPIANPKAVQHHSHKHTSVAKAHRAEDPWHQQIESQMTDQQKQITEQQKLIAEHQRQIQETQDSVDKTRTELESNLQATRDDLNGSIARTHDELVALEKKGERTFYEFDLPKSKQFQKEGPISVSLRKTNTKHEYCDLELIVNDSEVSKKHVDLYEPVLFYPEGSSQPLQVVVNGIGKQNVRGYVSEPKYKPSQLAAGSPSGAAQSGTAGQSAGSPSTEAATLKRRPDAQP